MNHIPEVAKMLGVEVREVFAYENDGGVPDARLKFTDRGLAFFINGGTYIAAPEVMEKLITGEYKVIKLPWKPGREEDFYFVDYNGDVLVLRGGFSANTTKAPLVLMGNCFRTEAEAKEHKDEIMEKYKGVFKE